MKTGFSTILILLVVCHLNGQGKYQLPDGVTENQINQEWIVAKFRGQSSLAGDFQNQVKAFHEINDARPSILDGMCKIRLQKGEGPIELINRLLKDPNVVYAEPILNYQPLYAPSDPDNNTNQDYLEKISAYEAWDVTRGDDDITIAIIDSGLDLDHEDLVNSIWINEADPIDGTDNDGNGYVDDYYGYDFADGDNDPNSDGSDHGTRVGGLAAADTDNGVGISGVGFNTKIAALKGFTTIGTNSNNLFEAVMYAVDNGMQILNLSWGSLRDGLQSEQDIINYAVLEKNAVVIAAAGNTDVDGRFHPAGYDNVISVGATNINDTRWSFSTYHYSVDIMAPGSSVYSTLKNDNYGTDSGTSYAAPMVAGAAALVMSQFPDLNSSQIMERLRVSADDIYGVGNNAFFEGKMGLGRLNVLNAVTATGLKSLRITDVRYQTSLSSSLFPGDTVTVTADVINYLTKLNNPSITISSPDDLFTPLQSNLSPGSLATLEEDSISFHILLNSDLDPETPFAIRLDYQDGAYSDFQFLETSTSPDYFDLGDHLKMTISGKGNLGYADTTFNQGIGITFNDIPILTHSGLMLATSSTDVTNNFISDYLLTKRDDDFESFKHFQLRHHPAVDIYGYSEFQDTVKNLIIEQSAYAQNSGDYIIIRYRIINNSVDAINNLSAGLFSDFNLTSQLENRAEYDATGAYLFTSDQTETLFAGTKIIADGTPVYSALDMDSQNGNSADINGIFSDVDKFDFLTNQQLSTAGSSGNGNDVAMLNGVILPQIDAFNSRYFTVILAASESKAGLETVFSEAESMLAMLIEQPVIIESTFSCEGSQVTLDPENGEIFQFYQDAGGSVFLYEGTSFITGTINQDTIFYVRNIDGNYPTDLFQYQVKLLNDIADFTMSPDTLYLDNPTNIVSFKDQSIKAISWTWDFGEGTSSTQQNPMLSYGTAGEYIITLSVENEAGCLDSMVKTLVVTDRPQSPAPGPFTICPGESITLSDSNADLLYVYETEEAAEKLYSGNDLIIGPFFEETTLFVSGVYNQFESLRVPMVVTIDDFPVDIVIHIDTLSTDHQIIAQAVTDETVIEWLVNGMSQGSMSEISIPFQTGAVDIVLTVENSAGCSIDQSTTFSFSGSPIPSQQDITICEGIDYTMKPGNGEIFGFYTDETLSTLIKKGSELLITDQTTIYIAGLDDGLPGTAIEVNISYDDFNPEITTATESIADKNKVSLSSNPVDVINNYRWFLDGVFIESGSAPILFLDNEQYEVVLEAVNQNGCIGYDTLNLDFIPPLGIESPDEFTVYPNPTRGIISIQSREKIRHLSLWDLTGKVKIDELDADNIPNLSNLPSGIYILRAISMSNVYDHTLILQTDN
ncbi:MAG: S8 family serine peptidase [Cyclobacteriaceae bacterium]